MKVRAVGSSEKWVGYYGHVRRRGGDVFELLRPEDFSDAHRKGPRPGWMEKVEETVPETKPEHFNKLGWGQKRPAEEVL